MTADVDLVAAQAEASIAATCRILGVPRSTVYERRSRPLGQRAKANRQLDLEITAVFREHKGRYGSPRIYHELKAQGRTLSRKRVAKRMRKLELSAHKPRRFRRTSKSNPEHAPAPNILARDFTASAPDTKWAADITYVWTLAGWVYVALISDLFSRAIVGWATSQHCDEALARKALESAVARRKPASGLTIHTDRGATYTAAQYRARLRELSFVESMSRKGDCWDNAPAESKNGTLKREALGENVPRDEADLRATLFSYIEVYYNRKRRHSSIGYISPAQKEAEYLATCGIIA